MYTAAVWALAQAPFLRARDLAILAGIGERAAQQTLGRLVAREPAWADWVMLPGTHRNRAARSFYLTPQGVEVAATTAGVDRDWLVRHYGLGEHALLHRLPRLAHLWASRAVMLNARRALRAGGGDLRDWRAWPVHWRGHGLFATAPWATAGNELLPGEPPDGRVVELDGEGHAILPDGRTWHVAFVWDGAIGDTVTGHDEQEPLHDRLDRLDAVGVDAGIPPVLVITDGHRGLPRGYRAGVLWTTTAEIAARGFLGARWHVPGPGGGAWPLGTALWALGTRARRSVPAQSVGRTAGYRVAPCLQERAQRLHGSGAYGSKRTRYPALLLPLVVPPRDLLLLHVAGAHPLLTAPQLARATGRCGPFAREAALRALLAYGLLAAWRPADPGVEARYLLTQRGLGVLASRCGLSPGRYREAHALLVEAGEGPRGLAAARLNLRHTDGINSIFLTLLDIMRAAAGTLTWRGEWGATRAYRVGTRHACLKPDACATLEVAGTALSVFVEYDSGLQPLAKLRAKIDQYDRYRAAAGPETPALLLVTRPGRCAAILAHGRERARRRPDAALDLRVTTPALLARGETMGGFLLTAP